MTEQKEQSMEAILASLRSVLADDDDEDENETPPSSEESKSADNPASVADEEKPEPVKASEPFFESDVKQEKEFKPEAAPIPAPKIEKENESIFEEKDAPAEFAVDVPEEEDVLDLTAEMIVDDPSDRKKNVRVPASFASVGEDDDDDFTPEPVIPREPMKEETLTDLIKENAVKKFGNDMLLAEPTVAAATESLSHLRDIASERQLDLGNGTLTIETIVRETMKPYLKEWLDLHLPEIVERVVRKEVAHIMDRLDLK